MNSRKKLLNLLLSMGAALLLFHSNCLSARAGESYYMMVFAAQRTPNLVKADYHAAAL